MGIPFGLLLLLVICFVLMWVFIPIIVGEDKIKLESAKVYDHTTLIAEKKVENDVFILLLYYPNGKIHQKIDVPKNKYAHETLVTVFAENGDTMIRAEVDLDCHSGFCRQRGKINGYYSNGHLKFVGEYTYGGYNGDMKFYYENGDLELILKFKDDKPKKGVIFTPDGLEKELTTAHIYNIINDYGLDNIRVDLSWVKNFYTN